MANEQGDSRADAARGVEREDAPYETTKLIHSLLYKLQTNCARGGSVQDGLCNERASRRMKCLWLWFGTSVFIARFVMKERTPHRARPHVSRQVRVM